MNPSPFQLSSPLRRRTVQTALLLLLAGGVSACKSPAPTVHRLPQAAPAPVYEEGSYETNADVSGIAQREVIRRQAQVQRADQAALEAAQRQADGDLEGAVKGYERAVNTLPASN